MAHVLARWLGRWRHARLVRLCSRWCHGLLCSDWRYGWLAGRRAGSVAGSVAGAADLFSYAPARAIAGPSAARSLVRSLAPRLAHCRIHPLVPRPLVLLCSMPWLARSPMRLSVSGPLLACLHMCPLAYYSSSASLFACAAVGSFAGARSLVSWLARSGASAGVLTASRVPPDTVLRAVAGARWCRRWQSRSLACLPARFLLSDWWCGWLAMRRRVRRLGRWCQLACPRMLPLVSWLARCSCSRSCHG